MYISVSDFSYYNFIKAKENLEDKKIFLFPDEVKSIESKNSKYIQMFFNLEDYGIESYSFGKHVAGSEIIIAKTKFREKTCACERSGGYFRGYFLIYNDNIMRIRTDKRLNIENITDIYYFFGKYSEISLPQNITTINDIIVFLENINK